MCLGIALSCAHGSSFHLPCFLFLKSQPDYLELYDFDSSIFCKYVLLFQIRFLHELQCHSFFILKFFFLDRLINLLLMFNFLFLNPLDFFDRISYYFLFLMLIFFSIFLTKGCCGSVELKPIDL